MPVRLEIAFKPELFDPDGATLARKARDYFGLQLGGARAARALTFDFELSDESWESLRTDVFTNPVTEVSSFSPLAIPADWVIGVGYLPGVKDTAGETDTDVGCEDDGSNPGFMRDTEECLNDFTAPGGEPGDGPEWWAACCEFLSPDYS